MRNKDNDKVLIALLAVLAAAGVVLSSSPVIRTLCGLLLVFVLPGYAIIRVVLPETRNTLAGVSFVVGLSVAVTVFCGFALHGLGGMSTEGWAFALGAVTVAASCVASFRPSPDIVDRAKHWPPLRSSQALMLVGAAAVAAAAVALAQQGAHARREFSYTEFWMVPTSHFGGSVTIGFRNGEGRASSYDVEVMLDERVVAVWRSIPLQTGDSWATEIAVPLGQSGGQKAEAWLFKDGDRRHVYRRVWLKVAHND
jgi:uncharacterized membrane protein